MNTQLLGRLLTAATLAITACNGTTSTDDGTDTGTDTSVDTDTDTDSDSGTDTDSDSDTDVGPDTSGLDPVPAGDYPICDGEGDDLAGECCENVYCYTPSNVEACPEYSWEVASEATGEALGSGTCTCSGSGPYNSDGADAYTDTTGSCCYVISLQTCTGRPLLVNHVAREARSVQREDWQ